MSVANFTRSPGCLFILKRIITTAADSTIENRINNYMAMWPRMVHELCTQIFLYKEEGGSLYLFSSSHSDEKIISVAEKVFC